MATDFGGKGSRRTFAARLLREVQAQSALSGTLVPQIAALPAGTLVSTDRLPAVSAGGAGKTLTPANFLAYILPDADKGDITTSALGATWTIDNGAVTLAKMADISTQHLIGRHAVGSGTPQLVGLDGGLEFNGANIRRSALTGDVTASAGSGTTTIANDAVTYAKMQNVSAASRLLGRGSAAGAGDVEELTIGSGLTLTGTVLSATGGGTGDVVGPASATDNAVARFDLTTGKLIQNSAVTIGDDGILIQSATSSAVVADFDGATLGLVSTIASPNTQTRATGLKVLASLQNTGTIGTLTALSVQAARSAGTPTNVVGLQVGSLGIAAASTQYGIKVEGVTGAATNFALHTGAGEVRLGDVTTITAGSTTNALTVTTTGQFQQSLRYDASNRFDVSVSSGGTVSLFAAGAAPNFAFQNRFSASVGASNAWTGDFVASATAAAANVLGARGIVAAQHSSGTVDNMIGLFGQAVTQVAGGTTTLAVGLAATVSRSDGTLTTGVSVDVTAMTSAMTNAYGIRVGNVTGGSSLNRAISTGTGLVYFGDKVNIQSSSGLEVNGTKVVGVQGATITDPTGGTVQDSEARTAINTIIDRLQAHGLIA